MSNTTTSSYDPSVRLNRRRYPDATIIINSHREQGATLRTPKDLLSLCSTDTGPLGVIAIPCPDGTESIEAALLDAKKHGIIREIDCIYAHHGIVQVSGFVSDQNGLMTLRQRLLGTLVSEGVDPATVRLTYLPPQSRGLLEQERSAYELLDIALGKVPLKGIAHFDTHILPLDAYLGLVSSLCPGLIGQQIRVVTGIPEEGRHNVQVYNLSEDGKEWEMRRERWWATDIPLSVSTIADPGGFVIISPKLSEAYSYDPSSNRLEPKLEDSFK